MTWASKCLYFQYIPDNLHNFLHLLWPWIRCMPRYHTGNGSEVNSLSTHCDGPKGDLQRKVDTSCEGTNTKISYKLMPGVGSRPYEGFCLGTYLWTHINRHCLLHPGWEGMGSLLSYNHSWPSLDLPHFTTPANVAALTEQEFAFSGVVCSFLLRFGVSFWHNLQRNEHLEVGQPPSLRQSCQSLQSSNNQLWDS